MADVQITSPYLSLNWRDALKGGIVAAIMSVMTILEEAIRTGGKIDWVMVGSVGGGTLVSYLLKNLFTPATVQKTIPNDEVADVKAAGSVDLVVKP